MTDSLFTRLDALAREGQTPPLDLAALHARARTAHRRRRVTSVAVAAVLVAAVGAGASVLLGQSRTDSLGPAAADRTAVPSASRLDRVLADELGATRPANPQAVPPGPIGPNQSAFGGPGREIMSESLFALSVPVDPESRTRLDVHWYAVSPPLSDEEAGLLSRGIYRSADPEAEPAVPAATPMTGNPDGRRGNLRSAVHFLPRTGEDPDEVALPDGEILALAWDDAGGIAQIRITGSATDHALAARADRAVQQLLRPVDENTEDDSLAKVLTSRYPAEDASPTSQVPTTVALTWNAHPQRQAERDACLPLPDC